MKNSRFQFPTSPNQDASLQSQGEGSTKSEMELKRELLRKKKEELEKKLDSQIKVRGNELVKSVRKQVEQLEGDFRRRNMNSTEQIDSIRLQAIESLDKQVRIIRSELERIHKTFNSELSHLSTELPEIEERGHVAAMSVSAYLASMLTLESD